MTHGNLLYQLRSFPTLLELKAGESTLNLLPPWHIYQRTCQCERGGRGGKESLASGCRGMRLCVA